MQKRRILINSIMSALEIVVVSGILFFLYRFLLNTIGAVHFGIWSLVLATTAVTQIADLGLSGGVIKFVAKYIARGENEKVSRIIQTVVLTIGVAVGALLVLAFPLLKLILAQLVPAEALPMALAILPYALVALWLCMLTSLFLSGLDGYQRFDIRSMLLMSGSMLHLLLCFWLVPRFGILGLAYAKVAQNASVMVASWLFLKRLVPGLPLVPRIWSRPLFKEMIAYCIQFQVISVATMLYDPVTKALLSRFGSLSMVAYYQMASKIVTKLHALIIAANQVLVPAIAGLKERTPDRVQAVYMASYRVLFFLEFPFYSLFIVSLPLISRVWLGYHEPVFVMFAALLSLGWMLATLASPAYHASLGIGKLRWNVAGNLTTAVLNAGLGLLLARSFGGVGAVAAWVAALVVGHTLIYVAYHVEHGIPLAELVPRGNRFHVVACALAVLAALSMRHALQGRIPAGLLNVSAILLFVMIVWLPYWRHPLRKKLSAWVRVELLGSRVKASARP